MHCTVADLSRAFTDHEQTAPKRRSDGFDRPRHTLDELTAGDVVIKAEYSSVNYKDALAATGTGKILRRFPLIGGIDVRRHGRVEHRSRASREGDRVLVTGYDLGWRTDGGYAALVRVPADWVVRVPDGLTTREAMVLGTAGFTAALAIMRLERNGLAPGTGTHRGDGRDRRRRQRRDRGARAASDTTSRRSPARTMRTST